MKIYINIKREVHTMNIYVYQKSKQPRLVVNLYVIKALSSGISW